MIDPVGRRAILDAAVTVALHALRLVPVAAFSPFLGGPLLPPSARIALAASLGAVAAAGAAPGPAPAGADLLATAAREVVLGAILAVGAAVPFEAARAAGRLIDTLRGATLAELHVAPVRQRETAVGDLLAQWLLALAAWSGADRLVVVSLLASYRSLPVNGSIAALDPASAMTVLGNLLGAAVAIGTPAAVLVLATEIGFAAAARLSPRGGFPDAAPAARAAAGIVAVALATHVVAARLVELATGPAVLLARLPGVAR